MIPPEKQTLREQMRSALKDFPDRALASAQIASRLRDLKCWQQARVVYGFSPLASEPDWRLGSLDESRVIAYPRVTGEAMLFYVSENFHRGSLGAAEPSGGHLAPPPDLILVPGLAFDAEGHRLGRGRGFYDRWLSLHSSVVTLGLCFDRQIVDHIPRESHDLAVDGVLTESRNFVRMP